MPINFVDEGAPNGVTVAVSRDYDYDYPNELRLKPGTELHDKLVREVLDRASLSKRHISPRYDSWRDIDRLINTYMYIDQAEAEIKAKDSRRPVSIVFPESLAILETIMSYLTASLYGPPIWRYVPAEPDDHMKCALLELVVQHLAMKFKVPLNLYVWIRDALVYGVGYAAPTWTRRWRRVVQDFGVETRLDSGNSLININPYTVLPDPTVSPHEIQRSEFFGWGDVVSLMELLADEDVRGYFNVKYVKDDSARRSIYADDTSERTIKSGTSNQPPYGTGYVNPVGRIQMYIHLIPADWELGSSTQPETWKFTVVADKYLVEATPLQLAHGLLPVVAIAPDFDGYSFQALARMEILQGLQGLLDWLLNSHVKNVRKTVNNTLIVDPGRVDVEDIINHHARGGGIVRLRTPFWGQGIKDAVHQLAVSDITRQHVADSGFVVDFMQRVAGTDAASMGMLRSSGPERLSAREFLGTRQGTLSRIDRILRLISFQGMIDVGVMFAYNVQEFLDTSVYTKITGRHEEVLSRIYPGTERVSISAKDLLVDFDVEPFDNAMPGATDVEVYLRFFEIISRDPELRQQFNLPEIAMHMLRESGAKITPSQLRGKVQVMPDAQVQQAVQAGNLTPVGVPPRVPTVGVPAAVSGVT